MCVDGQQLHVYMPHAFPTDCVQSSAMGEQLLLPICMWRVAAAAQLSSPASPRVLVQHRSTGIF